jgi:hypothetical protein
VVGVDAEAAADPDIEVFAIEHGGSASEPGVLMRERGCRGPEDQKLPSNCSGEGLPLCPTLCGSGARWCARADAMFDVPVLHVLDVGVDEQHGWC